MLLQDSKECVLQTLGVVLVSLNVDCLSIPIGNVFFSVWVHSLFQAVQNTLLVKSSLLELVLELCNSASEVAMHEVVHFELVFKRPQREAFRVKGCQHVPQRRLDEHCCGGFVNIVAFVAQHLDSLGVLVGNLQLLPKCKMHEHKKESVDCVRLNASSKMSIWIHRILFQEIRVWVDVSDTLHNASEHVANVTNGA